MNPSFKPSIQSSLALLTGICFIPALLIISMLTLSDYKYARSQLIDNSVITARTVMSVIDKDLSTIEVTLQTLAMSPSLGANDFATLYRHAKEMLGTYAIHNIIVTD